MIAEEKLAHVLKSDVRVEAGLVVLGLVALVALGGLLVYVCRQFQKKQFIFNGVSPLKINDWEFFSLLFLLALLAAQRQTAVLFYPVTILGVVFLLHSNKVRLPEFWGLRRYNRPRLIFLSLWLCLVAFVMMLPLSLLVDWVSDRLHTEVKSQESVNLLLESRDPIQTGWLLFSAIVMAPFAEEMLFRGFLYPFLKARMPAFLALVLVSLLFAFIHFDRFTFLQLFVFALFLGSIFEHTGSLPLCIGLHMCFNACNAVWLLILKYLP